MVFLLVCTIYSNEHLQLILGACERSVSPDMPLHTAPRRALHTCSAMPKYISKSKKMTAIASDLSLSFPPAHQNMEVLSPRAQSLCEESDIPALDLSLSSTPDDTAQTSIETSKASNPSPGEDTTALPPSSSPPAILREGKPDVFTLIDILSARNAAQKSRVANATDSTPKNDLESDNNNSASRSSLQSLATSESLASSTSTHSVHDCGPMTLHPDVDFTIEDPCGVQMEYTVYTCHHIANTDMIILSQSVLGELEKVVTSKDDKLERTGIALERRIAELEGEILRVERERDRSEDAESAALESLEVAKWERDAGKGRIKDLEDALEKVKEKSITAAEAKSLVEEAESEALSALDMVKGEQEKAVKEGGLLKDALQVAQQGISAARSEVKALKKQLRAAEVQNLNLRKDHEFAKNQSRNYLTLMKQSVDGQEEARVQLLQQRIQDARLAAAKIAEVERRNAELEEMLAIKRQTMGETRNGDMCLDLSNVDSSDTIAKEQDDQEERKGWSLGIWCVQNLKGVEDLESGSCPQTEVAPAGNSSESAQQSTRGSWRIKSLSLPGVWGGRTKESILPSWETP